MTLQEIFENLTYGEFSQLSIGGLVPNAAESVPLEKDYANVMSHINMALKALHTRFFLVTKDVIVQQYDHIQTYVLDRKYAETNNLSTEKYRYIIDSVYEPFQDDVLKIESIFDEDGRGLFLNDLTEPWSVFTPTYNSIQIPYPMYCNHLLVHYRASHPTLVYAAGMDPRTVEVMLPVAMLEPLLFYVASRAFSGLNMDDNQEGNNYMQKYEQSCKQLEKLGLQITPNYGNHRLDNNGWV